MDLYVDLDLGIVVDLYILFSCVNVMKSRLHFVVVRVRSVLADKFCLTDKAVPDDNHF